jgi:hypothetical protein
MALDPSYLNDINGDSDKTQSVYKPKRNLSTAGVPSVDNASANPTTEAGKSVWDNFSPGAATGLNIRSFSNVQDDTQRASAAAQNKADNTAMYGDPAKYIAGSKPPVDLRQPAPSVFSPDASQPTVLNPLGRVTTGVQPPIVPPAPSAPARSLSGSPPPGAAGAMVGAIPAVATAGPISKPGTAGATDNGDPANTPDITYDPQNRGLPNTTASIPDAKALAAVRDKAISDYQAPSTGAPKSFADRATASGGVKQADGSYAFSNMPAQPGYNANLDSLGDNANVVSARNMANPGLGTNGYTPTTDQGVGSTAYRGLTNAIADARSDNQKTQRGALSDIYSMANQDPRSVSGTAARNAAIDLKSDLESAGRYAHGRNIAQVQQAAIDRYRSSIGAAPGMLSEGMHDEAGTNDEAMRGLTSLGTATLNNDARVNAAEAHANAVIHGADQRLTGTQYNADQRLTGTQDTNSARLGVAGTAADARVAASANATNRTAASVAANEAVVDEYIKNHPSTTREDAYKLARLPYPSASVQMQSRNLSQPASAPQSSAQTPSVPAGMKSFAGYSSRGNPVFLDANGNKHEAVQ